MKTNKIAILISGVVLSSQAMAMTIYQDEKNTIDLEGAFLFDYFKPVQFLDHIFNTSRSTLGFNIEHVVNDEWTTDIKFEWDTMTNPPSDGDNGDNFRNRLGYISLNNDQYGLIRIGKQYSAYHDVAGYMDNLIVFDPDATPIFSDGKDGGFLGTARGDKLITYRNSVGNFNVSAQYGFDYVQNPANTLTRDKNYAVSVSYGFDSGLTLGATHLVNDVESTIDSNVGFRQEISTIAAKYNYEAFTVSGAFTVGNNAHETDLLGYGPTTGKANLYADATGVDVYAHYYFDNGLRPYVYLSNVQFDDQALLKDGEREIYSLGLSYHWILKQSFQVKFEKLKKMILVLANNQILCLV
ncbi:porin [Vibrio parahaemolyticus]|nr:porin [Vibrio parahaemolyticus]